MILEKIFPIHYYNELSGLVTDSSIVQQLLRDNFPEMFTLLEKLGGTMYLTNAINKWFLTIFINRISEVYSNLIWDLFLLEGNLVMFKATYALIRMMYKFIMECKNFDDLNSVFQNVPPTLKIRGKLAYYLLSKKFNFNIDIIKECRKNMNIKVIKEISNLDNSLKNEIEKAKKKNNKDLKCDLDWPICIYDFKDLEKNFDYIVLKQLPEPEVIDDYFSENKKYENSKNIINNEDKFEDLLIERKKHFCNSKIKSIRDNLIKNENIENIENKIIIEKIEENNIINLEENIEKKEINELIINTANENQKIINFEKEKAEDSIMSFD
jgi:hypothetical protein